MARQQCISPNSSEVSCSIKVRTWGHSNLDLFRTCDSGVALCLHTSMMVFPRRCSPFVLETAFFVFFSVFLIPPLLVSRAFCGAPNRVNGISKGLVECRGRGCEWTGSVKDAPSHISRCKITQLLIKCEETRQLKRKIEDQAAEHKARLQRYSDRHKVVLGLLKYNLLARKHLTGSICAQIEQNNKLTEAITQLQNENQRNQTAVEEASRLREENQKLRMDNEQSQTAMLAVAGLRDEN